MSDIFFPADLVPTSMLFGVDDFTAVDESATTGAMQSSTLFGTRRWHLRMDFAVLTGSRLARFEALVAALRGRQNRVWVSSARPPRGSFPTSELISNNTFANGTASWAGFSALSAISAQDRMLRAKRVAPGANYGDFTGMVAALSIPYAGRAMVVAGGGPSSFRLNLSSVTGADSGFPAGSSYFAVAWVPTNVSAPALTIYESSATGGVAGDYFDIPWASVARCALVDNAPNALLWSDDFSNAAWTKNSATVTANTAGAPDNTATMDTLTEAAATAAHYVIQQSSRTSVAEDLCSFVCAARGAGTRDLCIQIDDGANGGSAIFNLSTGAVTSTTLVGSGSSNVRAFTRDMGGGRWFCWVVVYCPASVVRRTVIYMVNAGAQSYLGDGASGIYLWRAGNCGSSFPIAAITQTTTVGVAAIGQTGTLLRLKGLPASTNGLLLAGDMVEIDLPTNSQLVRVTARLDSDAAGLGLLQFENALKQSPADGAAVIIQQPMGRFVLAGSTLGVEYTPGVFGQASLEFVEAA